MTNQIAIDDLQHLIGVVRNALLDNLHGDDQKTFLVLLNLLYGDRTRAVQRATQDVLDLKNAELEQMTKLMEEERFRHQRETREWSQANRDLDELRLVYYRQREDGAARIRRLEQQLEKQKDYDDLKREAIELRKLIRSQARQLNPSDWVDVRIIHVGWTRDWSLERSVIEEIKRLWSTAQGKVQAIQLLRREAAKDGIMMELREARETLEQYQLLSLDLLTA